MNPRNSFTLLLLVAGLSTTTRAEKHYVLIEHGRTEGVSFDDSVWTIESGALRGGGTGHLLELDVVPGAADFQLTAVLALNSVDGTAASCALNGASHFGFDGRSQTLFVEGPLFGGGVRSLGPSRDHIAPGKAFRFAVHRIGNRMTFFVDGESVHSTPFDGSIDQLAFRPHRNTMEVYEMAITGEVAERPSPPPMVDVYQSGKDGYHTYRIPAIVRTEQGTLLAFGEGRKNGGSDSGDIDLLVKRSHDNGQTWSPQVLVWDDAGNTCGNPAPVIDRSTGTIWLFSTWNRGDDHEGEIIKQTSKDTRRVFVLHSEDDGLSWSKPREITETTKQKDWTWYATGPCHGIQLTRGPHPGRLVIPCDHIEADTNHYYSHAIYSDDHGQTWELGGSTPRHQVNECTVVELADGRLMLNMRNYDRNRKFRQVAISTDGGTTWQDQRHDETLIEPICQASLERWAWPEDGTSRILFANPANQGGRSRMTVRVSQDEGQTWAVSKLVYTGGSAYSDLVRVSDMEAGLLFERDGYQRISYVPITRAWLEGE